MILFPGPRPWTFVIFWKKWQAGVGGSSPGFATMQTVTALICNRGHISSSRDCSLLLNGSDISFLTY